MALRLPHCRAFIGLHVKGGMIATTLLLGLIATLVVILVGMTILAACLWQGSNEPARNRRFRNHLDPDLGRDP